MKNSNKVAFPVSVDVAMEEGDVARGLTKREYFAGLAMQGLVSAWSSEKNECAKRAVEIADALLSALSNTKETK